MIVEEIELCGKFSEVPEFYVYLHKKATDGSVFYVGKGKAKRAYSKGSRNKYWHHVVEKHGYVVEFVKVGLTEYEAFELEKEVINQLDSEKLTNLTMGGHTTSGFNHTEETRKNQSEIAKQKLLENPNRLVILNNRLSDIHEKQKNDPAYREMMKQKSQAYHENLTEEEREKIIAGKTAWLKDPEKLAKARQTAKLTRIAKYLAFGIPFDENGIKIKFTVGNPTRKVVPKLEKCYLLNGSVLFTSMKLLADAIGAHPVAVSRALVSSKKKFGTVFGIYKGYTVQVVPWQDCYKSYEDFVEPLFPCSEIITTPILRSDGVLFLSATDAALSLGKKAKPHTTAEWVLKLCRGHNNFTGLGYSWKFATTEEITLYCEDIIKSRQGV